jgi:hypothetical protein
MVQVHTCVSVHCDQCGDALGSPGFEAHYPSKDAALAAAATQGWLVGPGGRWWCSACGPVLTCEAGGHEFTEWRRAYVEETQVLVGDGVGDEAVSGSTTEYRYCRRCCLHESHAPVLTGADVVGEVA